MGLGSHPTQISQKWGVLRLPWATVGLKIVSRTKSATAVGNKIQIGESKTKEKSGKMDIWKSYKIKKVKRWT